MYGLSRISSCASEMKYKLSLLCYILYDVYPVPAMDEETLSVALGYTCHVVSMIAQFLDLPLRYSMNSRGSRSTVKDFAIEKVAEKDRE